MLNPVKTEVYLTIKNFDMKRITSGIIALVVAVAAFAFTKAVKSSSLTSYYWFQVRTDGTVIDATSIPPFQSSDPFGCTHWTKNLQQGVRQLSAIGSKRLCPCRYIEGNYKEIMMK